MHGSFIGAENLLDNVQEMLGWKFHKIGWWYWRIVWRFVTPLLLLVSSLYNDSVNLLQIQVSALSWV